MLNSPTRVFTGKTGYYNGCNGEIKVNSIKNGIISFIRYNPVSNSNLLFTYP
jgi:hypothetical protein